MFVNVFFLYIIYDLGVQFLDSVVKQLITINRIPKSFCLHNIYVCTVYIYYVYLNTHTCIIYFENIYMYLYVYIYIHIIYIIYKYI